MILLKSHLVSLSISQVLVEPGHIVVKFRIVAKFERCVEGSLRAIWCSGDTAYQKSDGKSVLHLINLFKIDYKISIAIYYTV